VIGHRLGQRAPGDEAQLGGQVLHHAGHHIGHQDHPDEQKAVLSSGADVGRDVAGIDVGDGRDECRPEQQPWGARRRLGFR
jgi:hypothetical protein